MDCMRCGRNVPVLWKAEDRNGTPCNQYHLFCGDCVQSHLERTWEPRIIRYLLGTGPFYERTCLCGNEAFIYRPYYFPPYLVPHGPMFRLPNWLRRGQRQIPQYECPICWEIIPPGTGVVPGDRDGNKCHPNHRFCEGCFRNWAVHKMTGENPNRVTCPLCNVKTFFLLPDIVGNVQWIYFSFDPLAVDFIIIGTVQQ